MQVTGTIEIIIAGESIGRPVYDTEPAAVPIIVAALDQLANVQPVNPPRDGAAGEWTATDRLLRPVTVLLHAEPAFDETAIGRALAAGEEGI
jgi:hypothetical protein